MTTPESPLALAREYAELRYDIAQPELTVFEFDQDTLLRFLAALAQPSEPVAWMWNSTRACASIEELKRDKIDPRKYNMTPLYTAPPVAQPLSDEQIKACALMIKGICMTRPQDAWVADIEKRIRFMVGRPSASTSDAGGKS